MLIKWGLPVSRKCQMSYFYTEGDKNTLQGDFKKEASFYWAPYFLKDYMGLIYNLGRYLRKTLLEVSPSIE